ncbi:MAG: Gfo/Idh/MocA family oxidoreductase [candidate division Zixibacteria bacterium]|nr:Gfo/Idh/MocA family oxidoreductase [candidate division Zixibacteria bacterium]
MKNGTLTIGLIGLGGVCGAVHYPGFSRIPGVRIAGLCEADAGLLEKRKTEWGITAGYTDVDRFLSEVKPDAVAVAVPNIYHRDIVLRAIRAGCHIICEKPLGLMVPETVEMYETARRAGVRHMTAFTYRFVPGLTYIKSLVTSGTLGEIRHARFQRLQDWGEYAIGWRQYKKMAGTGELGDMGIHRLDFAEDLMGPIRSVCGAMKQIVQRDRMPDGTPCEPQDVDDWVAWIAEFESGTTGVFEMGKLTKGRGPKGDHDVCELNGTEASAIYQLHTPHTILVAGRGKPYVRRQVPTEYLKRPGSPRDPEEGDPVQTFRYDQAWEFVSAIRENRDCLPSFYHGMRAQVVAETIVESAVSRRWVNVPTWTREKQ